jgi:hypothetical protein
VFTDFPFNLFDFIIILVDSLLLLVSVFTNKFRTRNSDTERRAYLTRRVKVFLLSYYAFRSIFSCMKSALCVFGIFLLAGALMAFGYGWRFHAPGERERQLQSSQVDWAAGAARQTTELGQALFSNEVARCQAEIYQLAKQRQERQGLADDIGGGIFLFALLAFTLAAVWPKAQLPPAAPSPSSPAR